MAARTLIMTPQPPWWMKSCSDREIAAQALRITAPDLKEMAIIDEIIPEPDGGAHLDHDAAAAMVDEVLFRSGNRCAGAAHYGPGPERNGNHRRNHSRA